MSMDFMWWVWLLLIWFSLGSIYWLIKIDNKKKLKLLEKIEKRLAALEKMNESES